jgi:hypothetical protein
MSTLKVCDVAALVQVDDQVDIALGTRVSARHGTGDPNIPSPMGEGDREDRVPLSADILERWGLEIGSWHDEPGLPHPAAGQLANGVRILPIRPDVPSARRWRRGVRT